jgi:hypothetical protein
MESGDTLNSDGGQALPFDTESRGWIPQISIAVSASTLSIQSALVASIDQAKGKA